MTAGFRIDGREYEMSSIRRVTLRDTLTFNAEARRADLGITWAGLLALVDEVTALTVAERVNHEGTWLLMAAVIWSSRRSQGEDVSFLDAGCPGPQDAPSGFRGGRRAGRTGDPFERALAADIDGEVRSRLLTLSHVWPGVTPWSVWDLAWSDWLMFARGADEWVKARTERR